MSNSTPSPHFPNNIQDYAPWVAEYGLLHPYGKCQCGCDELTSLAQWSAARDGYKKDHPKRFCPNHAQRIKQSKSPSAKDLHKIYVIQNTDVSSIADEFGVHASTVFGWLRHHCIKRPPQTQPSKEQLHKLYVEDRISPEKIGKQFGYHGRTIRAFMDDYNIPRLGPTHLRKGKTATWNVGVKHTDKQKEANRQAHLGVSPPNKGKGDVTFICEVCGKVVTAKPYRKKRTCSKECKNKMMSNVRGKNHWNYKSDDSSSNQRQRLWSETREWRNEVLERADYTCQKCQQRGGRLTAHHIYAWATYPDKRFDIDNGSCLCKACHREFHNIYGTRKSVHKEYKKWVTSLHG